MNDVLVVVCTCGSREEAGRLAQGVVKAQAAACVNILPGVESVYRWQGKIETAQEVLLLMKTTRARFAELRDLIVKLHSYDTPEVVALAVDSGLEKYLKWVSESCAPSVAH